MKSTTLTYGRFWRLMGGICLILVADGSRYVAERTMTAMRHAVSPVTSTKSNASLALLPVMRCLSSNTMNRG